MRSIVVPYRAAIVVSYEAADVESIVNAYYATVESSVDAAANLFNTCAKYNNRVFSSPRTRTRTRTRK